MWWIGAAVSTTDFRSVNTSSILVSITMSTTKTPAQKEAKALARAEYKAEGRRRLAVRVKRNKVRREENWRSNHYGVCPHCGGSCRGDNFW